MINKIVLPLLLSVLFLPSTYYAVKNKVQFQKSIPGLEEHQKKIKRLPEEITNNFITHRRLKKPELRGKEDYDVNLLLLLIDFIPDNDPNTTGNGKFDFSEYDYFTVDGITDSIQTIGSPPHDSTYYHQVIKAMQYYYQTASLGAINSFNPLHDVNFHFKIFPYQADTAYHLPQKMAYYFPNTEDWDLRNERLIQVFKDAITTADTTNFANTPDIIFSNYNHIMIIHAGADWQHDVFNDTPCDLPAMYVELEEDSIPVNDSTYFIKSAAFSPETISQDFYKHGNYIYGFGALNPEMFHEFGHSLGFVDLYNTTNNYPAVGYWDIMDSGGMASAIIIDSSQSPPDTLVIEGVLPVLPSAWSRIHVWGEKFKTSGSFVSITSPTSLQIEAAELPDASNPQFIKIPINTKEYFLIENRTVDIDGEGSPIIKLDDITGRVPLYPMNNDSIINYEFDYMLPTWDRYKEANTNGGLCIWHIDNYVIYDQTVVVQGKTYSRYDANQVNGNYYRKGVKLVEADGIKDIGNPYSNLPFGTPYEPFFKIKAGQWSQNNPDRFHNYYFGPTSNPASSSNEDVNSLIEIYDISNYGPIMSFKFKYQLYNNISTIKPENKFDPNNELLIFNDNEYNSQNIVTTYDSLLTINNNLFGNFNLDLLQQIIKPLSLYQKGNSNHIIACFEDSLALVNFNISQYPYIKTCGLKVGGDINDTPISISEEKIIVPTDSSIAIYEYDNNNLVFSKKVDANIHKISYNPDKQKITTLQNQHEICIYDTSLTLLDNFTITSILGDFYPIIVDEDTTQIVFFQDNKGSIYKIEENLSKVFNGEYYSFRQISNITLGDINDDGYHDITFSTLNTIFGLQTDGSLIPNYPLKNPSSFYNSSVSPIIGNNLLNQDISIILPTESHYTQTISSNGEINHNYSFAYGEAFASAYYLTDENTKIFLPVGDSIIKILTYDDISFSTTELYWNGFKNGPERYGCILNKSSGTADTSSSLQIVAFPNPAESGEVRIRIKSPENIDSNVKIFNIAADLLYNKNKRLVADQNNEYIWPINDITSGIYYAIIKIGDNTETLKIGVCK